MPMIRTIHSDLNALIEIQESVINAFSSEMHKIQADKNSALQEIQKHVKDLLPAGNDDRYAELTRAIQEAGGNYDFTKTVSEWTVQDSKNRDERASIESRWGTRHEVENAYATRKAQLNTTQNALSQTSSGIESFDETTQKIEDHNKKYPDAQITEENHDGYESTNMWRWLGYYTFINRGPHHAYLAIGDYTKQHGDYYEIANDVAKMRNDQKLLESKQELELKAYNEVSAVVQRMNQLDNSYRGPEGIARDIRKIVADFLTKDDDFAAILFDKVGIPEATKAGLEVAKIRTLDVLKEDLNRHFKNAKATKDDLERSMSVINDALGRVGNESIYFDISHVESRVNEAARLSRACINESQRAREAIEKYSPTSQTRYYDAERILRTAAQLNVRGNNLDLDFSDLERKVRNEVNDYEAEQARLRAIAAAAAEAERLRLQEAAERAERARTRAESQSSINSSFTSSSGGFTENTDSNHEPKSGGVSGGSRGITSRRNEPS